MREVSYCFIIFIVTTSPTSLVIYSLKFLAFNILGIDFLIFSSGHRHENQHILGLDFRRLDVEVA